KLIKDRKNKRGGDIQARLGRSRRTFDRPDEPAVDDSAGDGQPLGDPSRSEGRSGRAAGISPDPGYKPCPSTRVVATRLEGRKKGVCPGGGSGRNLPAHRSTRSVLPGTADCGHGAGGCLLR